MTCTKCGGKRKVTVTGRRNGRNYRKQLACPECVCRCFLGEPCKVHSMRPVQQCGFHEELREEAPAQEAQEVGVTMAVCDRCRITVRLTPRLAELHARIGAACVACHSKMRLEAP